MSLDTFLALVVFSFAGAMTPGPNNVMLLASGANFGFRRSLPHIIGIEFGFVALLAAIGLGLGSLFSAVPAFHVFLKIVGGAYLIYLAWKIAMSRSAVSVDEEQRPLGVWQAALFQWVNPKAWVMSLSAMAVYSTPQALVASVVTIVACFAAAGAVSSTTWTGFGTSLRTFLSDPTRLKWFNMTMGGLLIVTLIPMLL